MPLLRSRRRRFLHRLWFSIWLYLCLPLASPSPFHSKPNIPLSASLPLPQILQRSPCLRSLVPFASIQPLPAPPGGSATIIEPHLASKAHGSTFHSSASAPLSLSLPLPPLRILVPEAL
ncbi:hypothetical protein R3P38DRAFT_3180182 [Favolaschia claudopus]|uniref:Uncharacterized protein n=1 Tax=Favolaschia claudopus TaxID=2862362 RepID=A0AAW0CQ78_9AGAR